MVAQLVPLSHGVEPVPGYRLSHFIGKGAYGEVWAASEPDGNPVALKFIPCNSQVTASREIRGLQSIRHLNHPNILNIRQIWAQSNYIIISMDLAEGSLEDLLEVYYQEFEKPIFPNHLCGYLEQAALALDFLNARQHHINGRRVAIRHCDVKPSNFLMIGESLKLADFSLAVQTTSPMWCYERIGTLNYASPEVFQGYLSDRSDQYSLAITYCELRSGFLPFPSPPKGFDKNYVRPEPDLSVLSGEEREIISKALSQVPFDRWSTCTEMIRRLRVAVSKG